MGIVAIFGGTFNPIHSGHREIINHLSNTPNVDKVIIIPTKIPPHKETDILADSQDRLNMCSIIASKYNNVEVSDIELLRDGKSYTIDTILTLQEEYKDQKFALTIGGDMLISFKKWKDYQSILNKCILFTFNRAGISNEEYFDAINDLKLLGAEVFDLNVQITDISSTEIRNELAKKGDSKFLDAKVLEYIRENSLYGV